MATNTVEDAEENENVLDQEINNVAEDDSIVSARKKYKMLKEKRKEM